MTSSYPEMAFMQSFITASLRFFNRVKKEDLFCWKKLGKPSLFVKAVQWLSLNSPWIQKNGKRLKKNIEYSIILNT